MLWRWVTMPRSRKSKENTEKGSPAWMTTFGDMMTLLLVFFVLLYSFSEMDLDKFEGFISALQARLGVLDGGQTITNEDLLSRGSQGEQFNPDTAIFNRAMGQISQYAQQYGIEDRVRMEITERGLVITITGTILYELGRADIKSPGREILDQIAIIINDIPNNIVVEGHTDNWPINNEEFPSNWELSTTRATNVIRYFIEVHNIEADRLSAAGYSEYRPLLDNNTAENRANNRRVEIVLLNQ
ncbi:flagellar motor protein MotB [Natronospora cellulosivora (SeqCode)]